MILHEEEEPLKYTCSQKGGHQLKKITLAILKSEGKKEEDGEGERDLFVLPHTKE